MGILRAKSGAMLPTGRHLGEVEYYGFPGEPMLPSVYHADGRLVPQEDGSSLGEVMDSLGGWVISSIDLVRFEAALDGQRGGAFLRPDILVQMKAKPSYAQYPQQYIGLGWAMVRPAANEFDWLHTGGGSGTTSLVFRGDSNGLAFAVSFNTYPGTDEKANDMFVDLYSALKTTAAAVKAWPSDDQWTRYDTQNRPRIADSGIVNAGSTVGGAVSAGEVVTLFGEKLGPENGSAAILGADRRFPTQLGPVRVLFDGRPAPLLYVSAGQINAVTPYTLSLSSYSSVRVQVETADGRSDELVVPVRDYTPGLFTGSGNGRGPAAILNQDLSVNSADNAARRGEAICLFLTGVAITAPSRPTGAWPTADDFHLPVRATVGGQEAPVIYMGAAPGLVAGVVQGNVKVPSAIPAGEAEVQIGLGTASGRGTTTVFLK